MKHVNKPQTWWPQYNAFFKKRFGLSVGRDGNDILVKKPDGGVIRIENPITTVEAFDAIERIGKAL